MNKLKKVALLSLLSLSVVTTSFAGKDEDMYKGLATWILKSGIIKRFKIESAIKKCKDIEWSKVAVALKELVINRK